MSSQAPLRLNGAKFRRDKTGLITITEPWEVYAISDAATYIPSTTPLDLLPTDRSADESDVGTWFLTLTYEGYFGPQKPDEVEVELDTSMGQDPIQSHPNFDSIKSKYGWNDDTQQFAPNIQDPTAKQTGLSSAKSAATVRNPMYGVESYLAVGAIFRVTMTTKNPPSDLLDGIGTIIDVPDNWNLLGVAKPKGRNWLKLAPKCRVAGNATHITMEWELSGPNGWITDVYGAAQLTI